VRLNQGRNFGWHEKNGLGDDLCHVTKREQESTYPGFYQVTGYDPSRQDCAEYADQLSTLMTHQKAYNNTVNYVDADSELTHPPLTNLRTVHQLFTRPYVGNYMGPGRHSVSPDLTDTESFLLQGYSTMQQKPCERTSGLDITSYGMNYLPCFGNPQRVEHVVEPPIEIGGWVRGGSHTRDFVRRVNYRRQCLNQENNKIIRRHHNKKIN
jgi:hypothetical protein